MYGEEIARTRETKDRYFCNDQSMKQIKLTNTNPERLDVAVSRDLELSRTKIQRAIKNEQIFVDDSKAIAHQLVSDKNKVFYDPKITEVVKKSKSKPAPLDIIYEDKNVIVINKPAGVIVHDTETNTEPTLVDALIKHEKKIAKVGDRAERAGLVHRLDKAASGIMIIAKNQKAFEFLKDKFQSRTVEKHYTVLVQGHMPDAHGTIDFTIERSKTTGRMAAKPTSQGGKPAITHYDVVEKFPHHTLLDIKIETGRTHQIRAHMFALEHPVVGDTLYRQKGVKPRDIGRIFLHARALTIELPNGETKTFEAPLPNELKQVLEEIPKL